MSARPNGLSKGEIVLVLALSLAVFLFALGPIWRHPFAPDASILLSYVPIPMLVALLLARGGRLTLPALVRDTLVVVLFKFGISATILLVLWSSTPIPARAPPAAPESARPAETLPPAAAPNPPARPALEVTIGGGRVTPAVVEPASGQDLEVRSMDGRLHTVALVDAEGSTLENVPLLASGAGRRLPGATVRKAVLLKCTVHPEEQAPVRPAG